MAVVAVVSFAMIAWVIVNCACGMLSMNRADSIAVEMPVYRGVFLGGGIYALFTDWRRARAQDPTTEVTPLTIPRQTAKDAIADQQMRAYVALVNQALARLSGMLNVGAGQSATSPWMQAQAQSPAPSFSKLYGNIAQASATWGPAWSRHLISTSIGPDPYPGCMDPGCQMCASLRAAATAPPQKPLPKSTTTEAIIGYRVWEVRPAGRFAFLESVTQRTPWPVGEALKAHCISEYPGVNSHNGLYAFKRRHTEAEYRASYGTEKTMLVYGTVALWGRVIEHQEGYRAEYAYPQSIVVPSSIPDSGKVARALANTYGIEVQVANQ